MKISVTPDQVLCDIEVKSRRNPNTAWFKEALLGEILRPLVVDKSTIMLLSDVFCYQAALEYREKYLTGGFWGSPMRFPQTTSSFLCGNFCKLTGFNRQIILSSRSLAGQLNDAVRADVAIFQVDLLEDKRSVEIRCLST